MSGVCGSRFRAPHDPPAWPGSPRAHLIRWEATESSRPQFSRLSRDFGQSARRFVPRGSSGDTASPASCVRLGQILILRGRVWPLVLAREPPGHLFLLFLFTLLLFLALFESLWSTTRHSLLLEEVKGTPPGLLNPGHAPQKGLFAGLARQVRRFYQRDPLPRLPPESFRLPP